ncbi:hypothetical protein BH10PSE4_BH10PSE4_33220 [soil metagenome]
MAGFQDITISKGTFARPIGPGSHGPTDSNFMTPDTGSDAVRAEFLKTNAATPAQRMREAELKRIGLSEESLKTLKSNDRRTIETQVREQIARQAKDDPAYSGQTGLVADLKV